MKNILQWLPRFLPQKHTYPSRSNHGFTLIEIMVVVVIVAILSSMAVVALRHSRTRALATTFGNDLRVYRNAIEQYVTESGNSSISGTAGQLPVSLNGYIDSSAYSRETTVGGHWIVDSGLGGTTLAFGVESFTSSETTIELADRLFDNGNINSGSMRLLSSNQYCYVISE